MKYYTSILLGLFIFSTALGQQAGWIYKGQDNTVGKRPNGWIDGGTYPYHNLDYYGGGDELPINLPNSSWRIIDTADYPLSENPTYSKKQEGWWLRVKSLRDGTAMDLIFTDETAMEWGRKHLYGEKETKEESKELRDNLRSRIKERDQFLEGFLKDFDEMPPNRSPGSRTNGTMQISVILDYSRKAKVPAPNDAIEKRVITRKQEKEDKVKKEKELKLIQKDPGKFYRFRIDNIKEMWQEEIKDLADWKFINSDEEFIYLRKDSDGDILKVPVDPQNDNELYFQEYLKKAIRDYQLDE